MIVLIFVRFKFTDRYVATHVGPSYRYCGRKLMLQKQRLLVMMGAADGGSEAVLLHHWDLLLLAATVWRVVLFRTCCSVQSNGRN